MPLRKDKKAPEECLPIKIEADQVSDEAIMAHWLSVAEEIAKLEHGQKTPPPNDKSDKAADLL